ncbi:MAG: family 10 glycosylhydrolase [Dysgonamonadaceae bacterium]|jgi:uncharacterized lipoprotein YddW (UPF0748 family)|nr:family 10 glycosylhydrolase [Dysgonamonadaceae bacterium]
MKRKLLFLVLLLLAFSSFSQITAKREFRGAWIHVIGQEQYKNMSVNEMKRYFIGILDSLQACHINALIFQVRPAADAVYKSKLEPWSYYLTGKQGRAPEGDFDPMAFLISEAHKRNMEFHAWLNPYRVTASSIDVLCDSHIYHKYPEWFVRYGGQIYFDPGVPESRKHICKIVKDIVKRYDIDAIHMDDYFYPYPIAGEIFPDEYSFSKYGVPQGFKPEQRDVWRRNNVNALIQEIKRTISKTKYWVRFGISPFGIYRNKKSTPDGSGSETNGLQNYDNLYADVKLWVEKEWIDYNVPQLYWEIGHKAADYETLIKWWSRNNYGAHLYIGQSILRTMDARDSHDSTKNQLYRKMSMERELPAIYGNCFWPGYELVRNRVGVADSLKNHYHPFPAMIPAYLHMHAKTPKDVKSLKAEWMREGYVLHWKRNGNPKNPKNAQYYIIYRFDENEMINLNDASKIVRITRDISYLLPYKSGEKTYQYVVTSVDRFHNESTRGKSVIVKL